MVKRITVVGAGTMGNGIAHVFGAYGWAVTLVDVSPAALDRALETIGSNLERQVKKGSLSAVNRDEVIRRIATTTELNGVAESALVVEAIVEDSRAKGELFTELDRRTES